MTDQEARAEREALANVILETTYQPTWGECLRTADAVLAWMRDQGHRQRPEPEWEYAHSANGYWNDEETEFLAADYGDVTDDPQGAIARRIKAGPWEPIA